MRTEKSVDAMLTVVVPSDTVRESEPALLGVKV